MQHTVFIDGAQGTTGLRIHERLAARTDLRIRMLPEERRKDASARQECIYTSDISFLCLPDEAAREAVKLAQGSNARIIDASTAHRTQADWCYGLPELSAELTQRIAQSDRVAVPGCHASGFLALIYPLVEAEILPRDFPLSCFSVTGYSGGGKPMIAEYTAQARSPVLASPRQYALGQEHKHLKEMQQIAGIAMPPVFGPVVADFYSGMVVSIPLQLAALPKAVTPEQLREVYRIHYENRPLIALGAMEADAPDGFLDAQQLSGKDNMQLFVTGNTERVMLLARYDNLGKGASGAAIQCMNLMLGLKETTGLIL